MSKDLIKFGVADLDAALDGGLPPGGVVSINGPKGSGKTALVQRLLSKAPDPGALIDADVAFDARLAQRAGVVDGRLIVVERPVSGPDPFCRTATEYEKHPFRRMLDLASLDAFGVVVLDSITHMLDWPGWDVDRMFQSMLASEVTFVVTSDCRDACAEEVSVLRAWELTELLESRSSVRIELEPYCCPDDHTRLVKATVVRNAGINTDRQALLSIEHGVLADEL